MLDIHAAREAYETKTISNIGFVSSSFNLSDGFTKPKMQASLLKAMRDARIELTVDQWILRSDDKALTGN